MKALDASESDAISSQTSSFAVQTSATDTSDVVQEATTAESTTPEDTESPDEKPAKFSTAPGRKRVKLDSTRPTKLVAKKKPKLTTDTWQFKPGLDATLPPMHELDEIFDDMASKAVKMGVRKAVDCLQGRKLKVATMCSGTESPILALELIAESLRKLFEVDLRFEHQFSAEIVPFKQAYIERNFSPPLIFRDIRELINNTKATTAYGAEATIPGDIDLLVAGFSCVDFSALNVHKKDMDELGESGDTFQAVLRYARDWRPTLVILENVYTAPWKDIQRHFEEFAGYAAEFVKLDTKQYYLPHTRQRGYMLAIDKQKLGKSTSLTKEWADLMINFRRPASSSIEAFLLHEDDPRVHRGREEMTRGAFGDDKGPREVEWVRCQGRHQDYRNALNLGSKRPITHWEDNGSCKMPDFSWCDWGLSQVERIWDTFEISFLRNMRRGFDSMYKTRIWELSQNIDFNMDTQPFGITGCITPTGCPYVTNRGGPLVGLEALAMQGLPIDKLMLTRESQRQLQDLAGNAMTSTVVGAAILGALIVGHPALVKDEDHSMVLDTSVNVESHICEGPAMAVRNIDLSHSGPALVSSLLQDSERSARKCLCEGRLLMTSRPLQRCKLCGHTTCVKCGGNPAHQYEVSAKEEVDQRLTPGEFEDRLKEALSMRLVVSGLTLPALEKLKSQSGVACNGRDWGLLGRAIEPAFGEELRFHSVKRAQIWTVYYESDHSRLELILWPRQAEWRLFGKPARTEPANSRIRRLLERPLARMRPSGQSLIMGHWEFCLPLIQSFPVRITGKGNLVRSFESKLGLQEAKYASKTIYPTLSVSLDQHALDRLDSNIAGEYDLLPVCGMASGSLHKKVSSDDQPPLFLFLDPTRLGDPKMDTFVFSTDIRRLNYGESRPIVATLAHTWRPSNVPGTTEVQGKIDGQWVHCPEASFQPVKEDQNAFFATSGADLNVHYTSNSCSTANGILSCSIPWSGSVGARWPKGLWIEISQQDRRSLFSSFAWLTEKVRKIEGLDTWKKLRAAGPVEKCQLCAPAKPAVRWRMDGEKMVPFEDPQEAAPYERSLKNRPTPFVTQARMGNDGVGSIRIGLNVSTLSHRASANLARGEANHDIEVSWRLSTDYIAPPRIQLPRFSLRSNKSDTSGPQPPHFRLKLRPEQLRSLQWMKAQEVPEGTDFMEEEVEEALLPQLGWRAEALASKKIRIRGGVLADEVGYGKTAITLGLIDSMFEQDHKRLSPSPSGKVSIKATLIIVPHSLTEQWKEEVAKFLGNKYKVLLIKTQVTLASLTIRDFQNADIIISAWPILNSDTYLNKLAHFAALPEMPSNSGRAFDTWFSCALDRLSEHLDIVRREGVCVIKQMIKEKLAAAEENDDLAQYVPSKRLRGQAYQADKLKKASGKALAGTKRKRKQQPLDDSSDVSKSQAKQKPPIGSTDPFGMNSNLVKENWTRLKSPLFQMFHFNRVVVDEYTYVQGKDQTLTISLAANSRWTLSGTPPLGDFADVKTIASFLGVNLGVDDEAVGATKAQNIRSIQKDRTAAEQFQAFRQVKSPAWHQRRHEVAQRFLDGYVRQNIAEIDEIPFQEILCPIGLPGAERAMYMELHQHLMSQDMRIRKGRGKADGDREKRLQETLGESQSPEEALLKRCSHFSLDDLQTGQNNAQEACDLIIEARKRQKADLIKELKKTLKHAAWLKKACGDDDTHFSAWQSNLLGNAFGDFQATEDLVHMVEHAQANTSAAHEHEFYCDPFETSTENEEQTHVDSEMPTNTQQSKSKSKPAKKMSGAQQRTRGGKVTRGKKAAKAAKAELSTDGLETSENGAVKPDLAELEDKRPPRLRTETDKVAALRSLASLLRRLCTEYVSRDRSLRFIQLVRAVQKARAAVQAGQPLPDDVPCSQCGTTGLAPASTSILCLCGHTACDSCLGSQHRGDECIVAGCGAAAREFHILKATELGEEAEAAHGGPHYGQKLEQVLTLIADEIPQDDRVLLFVQFDDLMVKVARALDEHGISHFAVTKGSRRDASRMIGNFQKNKGGEKVLVLNMADESASGANLANANHVIFLSPLLTDQQLKYDSAMTQAIGRARRYCQKKTVHIYRFVSLKTIDVDILEMRSHKRLVKVGDSYELRNPSEVPKDAPSLGAGGLKNQFVEESD
ncbi:MAG: hypothetical protein M1817_000951 [Caeruleum heppii]|nr:MAG: hypothetical protein M1817_000951 [Caeruleum heppii]